jgi:hypothetical protein
VLRNRLLVHVDWRAMPVSCGKCDVSRLAFIYLNPPFV